MTSFMAIFQRYAVCASRNTPLSWITMRLIMMRLQKNVRCSWEANFGQMDSGENDLHLYCIFLQFSPLIWTWLSQIMASNLGFNVFISESTKRFDINFNKRLISGGEQPILCPEGCSTQSKWFKGNTYLLLVRMYNWNRWLHTLKTFFCHSLTLNLTLNQRKTFLSSPINITKNNSSHARMMWNTVYCCFDIWMFKQRIKKITKSRLNFVYSDFICKSSSYITFLT